MIGQMRERISVLYPQYTQLEGGSGITAYFLAFDDFAKVENTKSQRVLEDSQIQQQDAKRFTIRYRDLWDIYQGMLVRYEGYDYTINSINEVDERKRFIEIIGITDYGAPVPIFEPTT